MNNNAAATALLAGILRTTEYSVDGLKGNSALALAPNVALSPYQSFANFCVSGLRAAMAASQSPVACAQEKHSRAASGGVLPARKNRRLENKFMKPSDVAKNRERPNDHHGSKVIVIPFDGVALDRDLQDAAGPTHLWTRTMKGNL